MKWFGPKPRINFAQDKRAFMLGLQHILLQAGIEAEVVYDTGKREDSIEVVRRYRCPISWDSIKWEDYGAAKDAVEEWAKKIVGTE